jgi:hypothetical protein
MIMGMIARSEAPTFSITIVGGAFCAQMAAAEPPTYTIKKNIAIND